VKQIAFFLPDLAGGGAERVILTLARFIREEGYSVDLVVGRFRGELAELVPDGIRIINLSQQHSLPTTLGLGFNALFGLSAYLRHERPAVLMSSLSRGNLVAVIASQLSHSGTRLVLREANTFHNIGKLTRLLIRYLYPRADVIVAVSQGVAHDLESLPTIRKQMIRIIYNPIDIRAVNEQACQKLSHPWFSTGAPPVILGVGRLTEQKDFDMMIRAFSIIRRSRDVRLLILGEGDNRRNLENLVTELGLEDDVALPGFVKNPYYFIKYAAIVAISSKWEGMINVIIEAIAIGTPVVSTDCHSGPAEILENGRIGQLTPVGDAGAFAAAIERTLDNPTEIELLQQRAKEFSVARIAPRYIECLTGKVPSDLTD
jgi:glycosyltransferase involved in cell wall biosynthesis